VTGMLMTTPQDDLCAAEVGQAAAEMERIVDVIAFSLGEVCR
jgi:HAMP domain-containing protein